MIRHLVLAGTISSMIMAALPASAANCASRDKVVEKLQNKYSESFAAGGLQDASGMGVLVEVWASATTGTFTVMLTSADGLSCIVATGTDWHQASIQDLPQGSPS